MNQNKFFETDVVKYFQPTKKHNVDLFLCHTGMENCNPSYSFGPAVRDHFIIHYVLEGQGEYCVNNRTYKIEKNQGFLIWPDTITYYKADSENPWTYLWIGFNGIKSEMYLKYANLDSQNLIFEYDKDESLKNYILEMLSLHRMSNANELKVEGLLYLFLSSLVQDDSSYTNLQSDSTSYNYISKSIEFINNHYVNNLKVTDIASYVGLNRSYLSNLFKKNLGLSPQEFLLKFRIEKACELLSNQQLSIGDISRSVGYTDPLTFSKIFKKIKGISPREYRNNHLTK